MQKHPALAEIREQLEVVLDALSALSARLDEVERLEARPPQPSYEEEIQTAVSTTAVFKAVERRVGLDRRTLLGKLQRLVLAHGLQQRFPDWSTNVALARYVAELDADGKPRLLSATERLG